MLPIDPSARPSSDGAIDSDAAAAADFQAAFALHRRGELAPAAAMYRALLQRVPGHFGACNMLGVLEGQSGRADAAVALLHTAIALQPDSASAHHNLAVALAISQRSEDALASFDHSLALQADNPQALSGRARVLRLLQRPVEALASLDQALALQPDFVDALLDRAELLSQLSDMHMNRKQDAVQTLHKALDRGADGATVHYALAALGAGDAPSAAPRQYVAGLFDAYADHFDKHLTESLAYATPALIGAALQGAGPLQDIDVLDLGCGTGLCAPLLRPLARRLAGVDLSANMLAKARERALYDELSCADIVEHLHGLADGLDLVVAADVFVYFGDLSPVFGAVQRVLRPGGLFVFSVETQTEADVVLCSSRRYAHATAHVERLAQQHGLSVDALQAGALREESGLPVMGAVFTLRRPR